MRIRAYNPTMTYNYGYKYKWVCKACGHKCEADTGYGFACPKCKTKFSPLEHPGEIHPDEESKEVEHNVWKEKEERKYGRCDR